MQQYAPAMQEVISCPPSQSVIETRCITRGGLIAKQTRWRQTLLLWAIFVSSRRAIRGFTRFVHLLYTAYITSWRSFCFMFRANNVGIRLWRVFCFLKIRVRGSSWVPATTRPVKHAYSKSHHHAIHLSTERYRDVIRIEGFEHGDETYSWRLSHRVVVVFALILVFVLPFFTIIQCTVKSCFLMRRKFTLCCQLGTTNASGIIRQNMCC